jgi:hypothetical protein
MKNTYRKLEMINIWIQLIELLKLPQKLKEILFMEIKYVDQKIK